MLYPLLLEPAYKERIWGGRTLEERFGKAIPAGNIGESWEIANHPHGVSTISNGPLKDLSLSEVIDRLGKDLLGDSLREEDYIKFPLLVKILDAKDILSVQVHPDDVYAKEHENGELGKTEAWYVMDAKPGAKLVYGIREGCTREVFGQAAREGKLDDYLKWIEVKPGDMLYIPAGMVHAIGPGILICEVQQNSDTVYRVYDWNRLDDQGNPRELHINKALDVIDFKGQASDGPLDGLTIEEGGNLRTFFIVCEYFAIERLQLRGTLEEENDGSRFFAYTLVEGEARISYGQDSISIHAGQSFIIPASMGPYRLEGQGELIKSYVPDRMKIEKDLENKGFTRDQLTKVAGLLERA